MRRLPAYALAPVLAVSLVSLAGGPAAAQDDRTFLEGVLENALAGEGRDVQVSGFRGALSSTATIDRITFADPAGVWLTLEDVVLDWNRAALLRGRLSVNTLSAGSIVLARPPVGEADPETPAPEASGFRLPDLPVAVRIGEISSPAITFGAPVFGIESTFTLDGSVSLESGEGAGRLDISRSDGPQGRFLVEGAFANATEVLTLAVELDEAAGGIVSTLAGLPGEPSVALSVEGQGPLSNFEATLALATDGEERLSGTLALGGEGVGPGDPRPFRADLTGDIAPLFAPAYRDFFGSEVALFAAGVRGADGALDLDDFRLDAASIDLSGTLATGPDGRPRRFQIGGEIASVDGAPVLLPLPGDPTRVDAVTLDAAFDAAEDDAWTAAFRIRGLDRPGFTAEEIVLEGGGNILGIEDGGQAGVTANLDFAATALDLGDPAAGEALGERVTGRIELTRFADEPLRIARFDIAGESYTFEAAGTLDIADRDLAVDGRARASVRDLSVFTGLAGRTLAGAAEVSLAGQAAILGGTFDASVEGRTEDLSIGETRIDALLRGTTLLNVEVARDLDGIDLSVFRLGSPVARITAEGVIRSAGTRLNLSAALDDGTLLLPGLDGRHSLSVIAEGNGEVWSIRSSLTGQTLSGAITGELDDSDPVPAFDGVVQLTTSDLSPLADLARIPALGGSASVRVQGSARADLSRFDMVLTAEENGLTIGRPDLDAVLAQGLALRLDAAREDGGPVTLRVLSVDAPSLSATLDGLVSGLPADLTALDAGVLDTAAFDGRLTLDAPDLSPLGALVGLPRLSGSLDARAEGDVALNLSRFDLRLDAQEQGLSLGRPDLDPLLSRGLTLALDARRAAGGPVTLEVLEAASPTISVAASGTLSGLPDALVPPPPGIADTAAFDGRIALTASDLSPLGPVAGLPGLGGALDATLQGRVSADLQTLDLSLAADGRSFRTGIPAADAYLAGSSALTVEALRQDGRIELRNARFTAPGLSGAVDGTLTDDGGNLAATLTLDDLGRIVEGFSGPATTRIEARTSGGGPWSVSGTAQGPGGTALRTEGTVARGLDQVDLGITGEVPLGLANPFIQPRSIDGRATLDLRLSGAPALSSLSGRIVTADARLVAPTLGVVLEQVGATVALGAGRAQLDVAAAVQGGGAVSLSGPVTLTAPYPGDLRLTFSEARLRDPSLFETSVSGTLAVSGPLAGGAAISGALSLGQTDLRIPSGVTGGTAPIPSITHVAEPSAVRQTRRRAGIIDDNGNGNGGGPGGPAYGLDIRIDALNRIFVRGRGLDAELGGSLRIGGTTANVIPAGQFDLIRGRLDILGRRLVLDEGSITLQGNFDPVLRLSATSEAGGILVSVILEGTPSDPDVRFQSTPELPEDEVVARLLFGRGLDTISPFQAAQLAASVATLTGGGNGLLGNLREGFGLDDLDIATDAAGQTQLTLGTYLTEDLYTNVAVSEGRTEIEINLDLTPSITLRGATADDGTSSIGIRFERDY